MQYFRMLSRTLARFPVFTLAAVAVSLLPGLAGAVEVAAQRAAYFYLPSDQVRALRDVRPSPTFVLKWNKRVDLLDGDQAKPEDTLGLLILGPGYTAFERTDGLTVIVDFVLRRMFTLTKGKQSYSSDSLFSVVDFRDMEAINRAYLAKFDEALGLKIPGNQQHLYEATLGVRARNIKPIAVSVSTAEDRVSVRFKDDEIAQFLFGKVPLTAEQGNMLAKALFYFAPGAAPLHPAALESVLPLRRAPLEISALYEFHGKKARSSVTFDVIGAEERDYPLPPGLNARIAQPKEDKGGEFANRVIDHGLEAIAGTSGKKRTLIADYAADAAQAQAADDRLGMGLAWLAASHHFPDRIAACGSVDSPPFCEAFEKQMKAAGEDPRFRRVGEAARHCTHHENEKGARDIASVDISSQPHGYVANMILFCLLSGLPAQQVKDIEGLGTIYPSTPPENALKAVEGNPYIPSYYFDIGRQFALSYRTDVAWRLFDIGYALGGGVKGDAFDLLLKPRERELLSLYPNFF